MRFLTALARVAVPLAVSMTWAGSAGAAAPVYTIQGFVPGNGNLATFEAVNASGVVLGDISYGGLKGTFDHGVVTELPQSTGGFPGTAYLNDAGDVVMQRTSRSAPHGSIAVLYTQGERIRLPRMGYPAGINAKGQVVGGDSDFYHPVIYENGSYRRLRTMNGQPGAPYAINDAGVVVGFNYDGSNKTRPAMWDADGHAHYLGSVTKVGYGDARAINNQGQVAGCTDVLGCYLYEGGKFKSLPAPDGLGWDFVRGISSSGIVLGIAQPSDDLVYCQGKTYLLEDLIAGDERGHWQLWAWAIGPAGHIVGSGVRDGVAMTFLATLASDCSAD